MTLEYLLQMLLVYLSVFIPEVFLQCLQEGLFLSLLKHLEYLNFKVYII